MPGDAMWTRLAEWLRRTPPSTPEAGEPGAGPTGAALQPLADALPPASPPGGFDLSGLLGKALDERNLFEAWERVRENDGAAGIDGQDVASFGRNVLGRLQLLRSEVAKGSYCPQPLKRMSIPKAGGKLRWLAIPSVRDRVLQTAVARVLRPLLEREFEEASYGYRTGRSVAMAVARVARHRDGGALHVVEADIENFFDNVRHDLLLQALSAVVPDTGVLSIVGLWLSAVVREGGRAYLLTRGVPQGSPLSPLLSNLYLDAFDETILARFAGLVRYADDFVILTHTAAQAHEAMGLARQALGELKLQLNEGKSKLTHFDEGFDFLGVRFRARLMEAVVPEAEPWLLPNARDADAAARHEATQALQLAARGLPHLAGAVADTPLPVADMPSEPAPHRMLEPSGDPALADDETAETGASGINGISEPPYLRLSADSQTAPLLQSLYIGENGVWLTKSGERLLVSRKRDNLLASIPLGRLDQVAVMANAMVSTALLRHCAEQRIAVYLGDGVGGPGLTLDRGALPDLALLDLQRRRHRHDAFNTHLARSYVEGKLHNAKVVLRRFARRDGREVIDGVIQRIDDSLRKLPAAPDCGTVRGLEGAAARAYFEGLRHLLPQGLGFAARRRRPPQDPTNALLGFGYSVLAANLHTLLRLAGLNVHFGALHATASGSQALVSDLMEELRAPAVDAVVLTLLRDGSIGPGDFEYDPGAELPCRMKPEARKAFVKALEAKFDASFIHPRERRVTDLRRAMQTQVRHYVQVLRREEPVYLPLKLK